MMFDSERFNSTKDEWFCANGERRDNVECE